MIFKKVVILLSAVTLVVSLSACSGAPQASSLAESPSSASVADESIPNLGITKNQIVATLDRRLLGQGYTTLSNSLHSELPHTIDSVNYVADFYGISDGMSFYMLSDTDGKVVQFTFIADESKINGGAARLKGYIIGTLPTVFEPERYEELADSLGILAEGDIARVEEDEKRQYSYTNVDPGTVFQVTLPDTEAIDIIGLDYRQGDVTKPEIDWTLDSFIDCFNKFSSNGSMPQLNVNKMETMPIEDLELLPLEITQGVYFDLGKASRIYMFTSACGRLERVELMLLMDFMDEKSITAFSYAFGSTAYILDVENAEDILKTINMKDVVSEPPRFASGTKMDYFYSYDNSSARCFISRQSPWLSFSPVNRTTSTTPPVAVGPKEERKPPVAVGPEEERKPPVAVDPGKHHREDVPPPDPSAVPLTIVEGGLYLDIDMGEKASIGDPITEFYFDESIWVFVKFDRPIENVVPRITWRFPDGSTLEGLEFGLEGTSVSFRGHAIDNLGLGEGSVTIEYNGEVLATYPFEVIE